MITVCSERRGSPGNARYSESELQSRTASAIAYEEDGAATEARIEES